MTQLLKDMIEFRQRCRIFFEDEAVPFHEKWERDAVVDREFWIRAGQQGLLGIGVDSKYGGGGQKDYRYALILTEELIRAGVTAPIFISHNDVIASYISQLGTDEQKERWLPDLCSGRKIAAVAVTEPTGGSDSNGLLTKAEAIDGAYLVNGEKAFITNGFNADLVLTAVKTESESRRPALSLLVIERGTEGFMQGEPLEKLGWHASDTSHLSFENCLVSKSNRIGEESMGGYYFMLGMPRERLSISTVAISTAERLLAITLEYAKTREAFGQPIGSFQVNRFTLAKLDTRVKVARVYLEQCIDQFNDGRLSMVDAARVKWLTTELQVEVADCCLQLHGAQGYMRNSEIGRLWTNSRVQTIYGGTSEIMLEFIGKSLGL
ncbi:acyl-CoA dehydrogenase family protein [Pseudomonas sp. RA_105y_Pfl1_P41]|uniref:acyl-CoA dehydrogenase family protein n=1 Tax=Pseudomonas sp. RA_105y_Pfl1_P41 TaxID=3088700 RepID=UPI0030D801CE